MGQWQGQRLRSRGHAKKGHWNIKCMANTSSKSENTSLLQETVISRVNDEVRFLTESSSVNVSAHSQWKCAKYDLTQFRIAPTAFRSRWTRGLKWFLIGSQINDISTYKALKNRQAISRHSSHGRVTNFEFKCMSQRITSTLEIISQVTVIKLQI